MASGHFPNHSGGVVRVFHTTRYGAVPEALLEDRRLGLDTRAVAAWLAIKASGWQINVGYLRCALALPGKSELGKDIWQRIASELESAGYLHRTKHKGENGQWVWHITFNPAPEVATIAGSAGYGSPGEGSAGRRLAADGEGGHITKQQITKPIKKTTTNNIGQSPRNLEPLADEHANHPKLIFPSVPARQLDELGKLISSCAPKNRQDLLDEIEGIRQVDGIKKGVIPLARALIAKLALGEFVLNAGHTVQAQRALRTKHNVALANSTKFSPVIVNVSEETIAQLPRNLQMRVRAAQQRAISTDTVDHSP